MASTLPENNAVSGQKSNQIATGLLEDRPSSAREPAGRSVEDLTSPSPKRIRNILWPVPVFERLREQQLVDVGDISIRPGDCLETLDPAHRESMLVVSVLPDAVAQNPVEAADARPHLLVYSDEFQTFRVLNAAFLYPTQESDSTLLAGDGTVGYYLHRDVADLVSSSTTKRADRTYQEITDEAPPLLSLREQFPESFDRSITAEPPAESVPSRSPEDVLGAVINEDVRTYLASLPSDFAHCIVTSPPYYAVRDYDVDGQLGQERTPEKYLEKLLGIVNQLGDIIRDDGTIWLVVDDARFNGAVGGLPEQFHQELQLQGFRVIHHMPWVKANGGKPDPASSRFADTHERILCLTPNSGSHYFSRQDANNERDVFEVPVGTSDTDHDAVFPKELPKEIFRAAAPDKVCQECGTPFEPEYGVTDIRNLPDRPQAERALDLAEKHDLSDEQLQALRSVGLSDAGQSARTQDGAGKNDPETITLANEAREVLGSYAREFTAPKKEHIGWNTQCECDSGSEPGVILDPFAGSGTSLLAAKELQLRWSGCELNSDYVAECEQRIGISVSEPERLTDEEQSTLGGWS